MSASWRERTLARPVPVGTLAFHQLCVAHSQHQRTPRPPGSLYLARFWKLHGWSPSCFRSRAVFDVRALSDAPESRTLVEARALDRSLLRGVGWTAGAKWAAQGLTWVSWLIVARLLSPED